MNPVRERLEYHAAALSDMASLHGGSMVDHQAAAYLEPLVAKHPTEALAARVIAATAADRGQALVARLPALRGSLLATLGDRIIPADGYRGSLQDQRSALAGLISDARADPAVQALFDGGRAWHGWPQLSYEGKNLVVEKRKLKGEEDSGGRSFTP